MACAGFLLVSVLAAASSNIPAAVRTDTPPALPPPVAQRLPIGPINLSVVGAGHAPAMSPSRANASVSAPNAARWDESASRTSINLGPLHAEFGGVSGRHMHLATVRLEGVSVFGANVGGSLDSRSARITLSWPTSN
jgi:hypothetical protein